MAAEWPGNIRQLNNVIELCATLSKTKNISLSLVKSGLQDRNKHMKTLKEAKSEFEKNYFIFTHLRIPIICLYDSYDLFLLRNLSGSIL